MGRRGLALSRAPLCSVDSQSRTAAFPLSSASTRIGWWVCGERPAPDAGCQRRSSRHFNPLLPLHEQRSHARTYQAWVPMAPMSTPRSYLAAVPTRFGILAIGGYIGGTVRHPSGHLTLDSVERYGTGGGRRRGCFVAYPRPVPFACLSPHTRSAALTLWAKAGWPRRR